MVLLCLLELALRLAGYGYDTHLLTSARSPDGKLYLIDNATFSQRFFPPQLARWPNAVRFAATKPPGLRRIFIFGESAAMGDPQPAYGPSRCLEVLLRERFPGEKFEVINLGITAINSHVILPMAREIAERGDGDVWLIYMGNNEMVGPFGAATVFGSRAPPLAAVRFNLAVQQTRLGQLAVAGLRNLGGKPQNTSWGGMQMFLNNQIPPQDPRRETVYQNFTGNLREIVHAGLDTGARVILSTMSVNLRDCPPFASIGNSNLPPAELESFQKSLAAGRGKETAGANADAAGHFAAAAALDPHFAEAQYRWGETLARQSNAPAALEHFQLACDADALPFRADTRINRTIREVAATLAGRGLTLCDAEKALAMAAPLGIPGEESFYEHVHFNFNGNYLLGRAWAEALVEALQLPTNNTAPWVSQSVCEARLGLTDWNRLFVIQSVIRRLNAPPLSSQFNNPARLQRAEREEALLKERNAATNAPMQAGAIMNAAIRSAPEDVFLYEGAANLLEATTHKDQAIAAYQELLKRRPHDFYAHLQLGRLLGETGRPQEGQPHLETATRLRPSIPDAWHELGVVLAAQQNFAEGLKCTQRTLALRPQDPANHFYHGKMLAQLKRHAEAITALQRSVAMKGDSWESHFELAGELAWTDQINDAIHHYLEALKLNPRHAPSRVNLGVMFVRQNRLPEAIEQFEAALKLDPNYREAAEYLAQVREKSLPKR